ncbi:T9SS type A sorting domain-containing protein [uncultured Kordia sp.]|uniref:T9SS type A sorting domain-containing protein n=1 Tax=uncultured Kordia sp. TaxID=507699 RepID=UPI002616FE5D|nr:T9SS type A sorting domain-containing protein [uncultured Kordia sp.]
MRDKLLFLLIIFMSYDGYAQIGFEENQITNELESPKGIHSVDIDNDGDIDLISASHDMIVWFENYEGQGAFGAHKVISTSVNSASSVYAADIDGDGDMDVLSTSAWDNKIAWYENTDGLGTFGAQQIISTMVDNPLSVYTADIDGDGDLDVLSASIYDNKIAWYENTDGLGTFGSQQTITTSAYRARVVKASDIDGDGDLDVISASRSDNKIAWYENTDGLGTFGSPQIITTNAVQIAHLFIHDVDGDGDMDVLSDFGYSIVWFENTDGLGTFGSQQIIGYTFTATTSSLFATDLDNDGDIDILSHPANPDDEITWFENTDGQGTFGAEQLITTIVDVQVRSLHATDLDGDGDEEVFFVSTWDGIAWFENIDGQGTVGPRQTITPLTVSAWSVQACDIDNDGDKDVLSASLDGNIAWYKNTDGQGTFKQQLVIATVEASKSVYAVDLDNDGDKDVLCSSRDNDTIAWYENTDGQGTFGTQQTITTIADGANSVYAADFDNDGDMDVLCSSENDDTIAWFENTDGQGTFGLRQIISTMTDRPSGVYAADLDGDGDMDVLSASRWDNKIAWYENTDGSGTFGAQQIITTSINYPTSVHATDLDGDGDMDVLSASESDDKIAWYENTDGQGSFGTQQIITTLADRASSVYAEDLDGDGDIDVLSSSRTDNKIAWYENTDGQGTFGTQQIISTMADEATSVYASDINGDGNIDVLSTSALDAKVAWYKNLGNVTNEISGEIIMDLNADGCDNNDASIGNLLVETTDGTTSFSTFSLNNGVYQLFPELGDFTTSIVTPLSDYYTVTPASATSNFTGIGNVDTVDFCLQPIGTHNDLNIAIYPSVNDPRPGFDTTYQIVYNNIGNTQLSGDITFEFNNSKMQFLNASQFVSSQTANTLTFNFTNLSPFETRTIDLFFNVFPPPTTNIDDILTSTATINPLSGDETPGDNVFSLRQTVIGSYDPNDIRVLEGDEILLEDIDKYLHYIIRFQNTGTASAINVRVEHVLDSKLDWSTMQLQSLSHSGRVEITNGNDIEFIFDNINLPDSTNDEPNSHGYITFKIKPKSDVAVGDIITGVADIYFDFNPPIITNTAMTEIVQRLSVGEFEANKASIYPNPTNGILQIKTKNNINTILVYDLNGRLLINEQLSVYKPTHELNVKHLSNGFYFLEVKSGNTNQIVKFIKN